MEGLRIREALTAYKRGVGELAEHLPEVMEKYNLFTEACFADGELSRKMKHLIALTLGIYTNDEYCIIYHTKGAVEQGATDREVLEAACVCGAFGGGMAMSQAVTLVQDALAEFRRTH
jgi:AhpD family alkylhydroperoxidase